MNRSILICISVLLYTGILRGQEKATLILYNANIITLDDDKPMANAVAILNNRIIAVGTDSEILKLKSKGTQIINVKGKTIIPGLNDSHLHVVRAGRFYNAELRWDGVKTLKRALQMLKEQAARTPDGQWVRVVGGWNEHQFSEKRMPTLEEINEATQGTPTFILYLYGKAYLNKAALATLNITDTTPNPVGGLIAKDAAGQPTGLLVADPNAFILYSTLAKLPELSTAEKLNSTRLFMAELNRLGVTSVMDAGGGFQNFPGDYQITDSLSRLGQLTVRLAYYLFAQKAGREMQDYQNWISQLDIDHQGGAKAATEYHVQGGGENLVLSGSDFENFLKPRPDLPAIMEKQLKEVLTVLVKNHWPFRLHATYDESISRFLTVIEQVNIETPLNGLPWMFDHAETVSDENLKRIKALAGGISIQHRMAYQGENFVARYGTKAASQAPPIRKILDLGIKLGAGTDGTRVSSYNPWITLYWLTTGKTIGGMDLLSQENKLDRISALKLFTSGSASLINQNADRGTVRKGNLADLVILSGNYLTVEAEELKELHSLLTILNGKIIYGTGEYAAKAPSLPKALPSWSPVNFYGGYQNH